MHLGSEVWIRGSLSKYQGSSIAVFRIHDILGWRLHHFSKIKSQEESQNGRNHGFSYYFCMMIEGSGVGSIPRTSGPYQLRFLHSASHPLLLPPFLPFLLPSFHLNPNSGWKTVWSNLVGVVVRSKVKWGKEEWTEREEGERFGDSVPGRQNHWILLRNQHAGCFRKQWLKYDVVSYTSQWLSEGKQGRKEWLKEGKEGRERLVVCGKGNKGWVWLWNGKEGRFND